MLHRLRLECLFSKIGVAHIDADFLNHLYIFLSTLLTHRQRKNLCHKRLKNYLAIDEEVIAEPWVRLEVMPFYVACARLTAV